MNDQQHEPFEDLATCVSYFAEHFPDDRIASVDESPAPKYLFRGENQCYPTTVSSQVRVQSDARLNEPDRVKILRIADCLAQFLQDQFDSQTHTFGTQSCLAAHFLQHYGLPTPFIDFTATIDTAAFFAADGEIGQTSNSSRPAKMPKTGSFRNCS
jgi:hypothetical protein